MIQHRLVWSAESLKPKLDRVSPLAGLKRLFSKHALVNFVKGLLKLVVDRQHHDGAALAGARPARILHHARCRGAAAAGARADAEAARRRGRSCSPSSRRRISCSSTSNGTSARKCRSSDLKEEYKQSEGDPHIKARIRRLREQRTRKRMMAAVPDASVVITNPTHYSVALKYKRGDNAPVCVAKGLDLIALKIREVAKAHSVPIVESPPLGARAACDGRDRPGNPARTLPRCRRNHRLCDEAAGAGGAVARPKHQRDQASHNSRRQASLKSRNGSISTTTSGSSTNSLFGDK